MSLKSFFIVTALLGLAACQSTTETPSAPEELTLTGSWHIEVINKQPVIDYSPAKLVFASEGKLSGNNSCNNFFGEYTLTGEQISLMPAGNTMKACVDALMDQEQRVMAAMPEVVSGEIAKGKLLLKDSEGKVQFVLSRI